MRISDWSSDVCSSDLLSFDLERPFSTLSTRLGRPASCPKLQRRTRKAIPEGVGRPRCSAKGSKCSRSEEHTSELQSLMRISYAVFCLKKKKKNNEKLHRQKNPYRTQYKYEHNTD